MENNMFEWVNPLYTRPFLIAMLVYQSVIGIIMRVMKLYNYHGFFLLVLQFDTVKIADSKIMPISSLLRMFMLCSFLIQHHLAELRVKIEMEKSRKKISAITSNKSEVHRPEISCHCPDH